MDALYFRVSSDRQTTENQFADVLAYVRWPHAAEPASIDPLSYRWLRDAVRAENHGNRTVYSVDPGIAAQLAERCVYLEQGRSGKKGSSPRPLFEQMKRDAAARKFDRLLVWKVSRLGRDMREVISTVYELADLGITVIPVKSQTGPITSTLGKLLWAIQAWYAEMENDERAEAIKAGQARARANGEHIGRPKRIFNRDLVMLKRDQEKLSWKKIAQQLQVSVATVRRTYAMREGM